MRRSVVRVIVYGGPFMLFLWPNIHNSPAVGIPVTVAMVILANVIVWKCEHMALREHDDGLD